MKRMIVATLGVLALSACASTPAVKTPAERILGTWTCHAESDGSLVDGVLTYETGGKAKGDTAMDVDASGMRVKLTGKVEATWGFQPDGKLIETMTSLKVLTAKMEDRDIPPAMIGSMVQPMVNQMAVGQSTTSTVVFDGDTMISTDDKGVATTCTR